MIPKPVIAYLIFTAVIMFAVMSIKPTEQLESVAAGFKLSVDRVAIDDY